MQTARKQYANATQTATYRLLHGDKPALQSRHIFLMRASGSQPECDASLNEQT